MKNKRFFLSIILLVSFIGIIMIILYMNMINKSDKKKFLIGISQVNLYEPWRINTNNEIKEEAEKYEDIKIIVKEAGGDAEKQKTDINDLMSLGVDLLIISINDSEKLSSVVEEAYKLVPVILLDMPINEGGYTLYIGSERKDIGRQAGNLVSDLADGKNIDVLEIQGLLNSSQDNEMTQGFKESIKNYSNISIKRTVIANWQKDEAQDKMQELIDQNEKFDVIFAHSDYMALGAYYALKHNNIDNVKIIGVDGLQGENGGIELVNRDVLYGTFTCNTGGKEAIEYAVKILNKEQDIPQKILLKCNKIIKKD